jgi:hypothetical protein
LTIVAAKATKEPETTVNATVDDTSAALEDVLKKVQEAVQSIILNQFLMLIFCRMLSRILMNEYGDSDWSSFCVRAVASFLYYFSGMISESIVGLAFA